MHQPNEVEFATTRLSTGVRLRYAERGDPTGEAIIFLHGWPDSWFSFSRVLPLLSPEYRAFAPDQRGHGESERPECCYTLDDFAADVDAFMDTLGINKATLAGHSMGSLIAQRVALSYPRRVRRLVLIGTATMAANSEVLLEAGEELRSLEDPVPPEFAREFAESTIYYPVPQEFLAGAVSECLKVPARVWRDALEGALLSVGQEHAARLHEIDVPTLILWGKQDAVFLREEQDRLAEAIADATLKVYPDTGHGVQWERPEQVVRDLETFTKDTSPAR